MVDVDLTAAGFGGTLVDSLDELRTMAESRMLDHFDIKVATGGTVYNPSTKQDETAYTLLFETCGRLKAGSGLTAQEAEAGGRTVISVSRELHIPVAAPAVPANAVAVPTYLHPSSDQSLVGAVLRLAGPAPGSQTTARRLEVVEVLT